ncbi:MAG: ferritin [Deltaproteobacteria bacterium]|nr:MAG: ferritin [Deltaproteobacteria bacterium]
MIDERMHKELNLQLKHELESAYLYLAMMAWFRNNGWDGMANWMKAQVQEEIVHAMKFFDHLAERGAKIELMPLELKKTSWSGPLEVFKDAYEHEQFITGRIHTLAKVADEVGDYAAKPMLQWFIEEQIEEEASTSKVAEDLERAGDNRSVLMMLDRELGQRVFTPPADTGE